MLSLLCVSVYHVRENLRQLRENLKHKIRTQRLLHRLASTTSGDNSDSGYGNSQRDSVTSNMAYNPDLQAAIPQIMHYLDQMHSGQQHLLHLWQIKKTKLEQCLQLRVFEQDCEKASDE